jgi:Tol biopolymer transport system component
MKIKILITIILGMMLVVANSTSADVLPAVPAADKKAESVGNQESENEGKESAWSAEAVVSEAQPVPESEFTPKVEPEAEIEAKPEANSDTPEKLINETKSGDNESQIVKPPEEPNSGAEAGKTSAPAEPGSEPEKDGQDETATESKPEEEKSQTAEQDAEQKPKVTQEPEEIVPLYVRKLVDLEAGHNDSNPVWSPSGKKIAFERSIGDKREIIISGLNGVIVQKIYNKLSDKNNEEMDFFFPGIAEDISYNSGISWSPAEESLVFMSNGGSGNYDLYLLPQLGNEATIRLTDADEKDSHSQWSPIADHLIFVSGRTGKANIYLMKLETKETIQMTDGEKTFLYPQWSPDGKKIAMIYGSNENHDIYLIDDITKPEDTLKALTTWSYDDLRPVWSPDGKKIAFYSNYNTQEDPKVWALFVIAADGSDPTEGEGLYAKVVATNVIPDIESGPAWLPDSKRIIYVKNDRQAYNPIYIVNVDEKADSSLKTTTKMNHDVTCSSDGTIAFRAQVEQWDHIYIAILPN